MQAFLIRTLLNSSRNSSFTSNAVLHNRIPARYPML